MVEHSSRILAAIGGLVAVLVSLYGTLWVFLTAAIAAQRPDATVADGDPCCPYPDSWTEVASWSFGALTLASTDALIFAGGLACLVYARDGCRARWRHMRWLPVAAVVVTATLMSIALA